MAAASSDLAQSQDTSTNQQRTHQGIEKQRAKLAKSVDEDKNYYEAHQMYRTVVNRYVKQKKYNDALILLHSGAETLLKHAQSGSGCDLAQYFVDTLVASQTAVTDETREHLVGLLKLLPATEPGRKRVIAAAVSWSSKFGDFPSGDPSLHHSVGTQLWKEKNFAEAERHLELGTEASARMLGRLLCDWATEGNEPELFGHYVSRGVLRLLAFKKLKHAHLAFETFCDEFKSSHPALVIGSKEFRANSQYEFDSSSSDTTTADTKDVKVFSVPLINFCQLLLLTVQRDAADLFLQLKQRYAPSFGDDPEFTELLDKIGQVFFNIKPQKQSNLLADLMSSLFAAPPSTSSATSTSSSGSRIVGGAELD